MYDLHTIRTINAKAATAPRVESETTRHCSFHASPKGVVLHSAKHRSTAFIEKAAAKRFQVEIYATNSQVVRDRIIESYYLGVPTGKQRLRAA